MPYVGRGLDRGNYLKLDNISSSFNNTLTTFNLTAGNQAFFPGSAFSILVVLAGVVQEPEAAYTINQSQITFASPPLAGDQFFCISLGVPLGINVPGNGTVDSAQLARPFNYDGFFYLDDANNRVGVGTVTPQKPLHVVGEGQFDSVRVLGDLTVDGTTTTLDTVVTEVDRLEVGANNNTVGLAVTQSGSGDAAIFMGGDIGINTTTPRALVDFGPGTGNGTLNQTVANYQAVFEAPTGTGNYTRNIAFVSRTSAISAAINAVDEGGSDATGLIVATGTAGAIAERLRITSAGNIGIGSLVPVGKLDVVGNVRIFEPSSTAARTLRITNSSQNLFLGVEGTSGGENIVGSSAGDGTLSVNGNFRISANNGASANVSLLNSGSVGIGTITPQSQFEVYGTSPIIRSKHSTSQKYTQIHHNGTDGYVDWSSGGLIFRGASNAERVRITSDGSTVIGGTTPATVGQTQLTLRSNGQVGLSLLCGTIQNSTIYMGGLADGYSPGDSGYSDGAISYNNSSNHMQFNTAGTERLRIKSDGQIDAIYGVINLGTADVSSGHINAYEAMTFNIDSDNDDTNRHFTWYKNGGSASGTAMMRLTEDGNLGINETNPAVSLDLSNNTDAVALPTGTTAQRPSGTDAYIRKNSTNNALEFYNGIEWVEIITDYFPTGSTTLG